jgi:hypothetical protein
MLMEKKAVHVEAANFVIAYCFQRKVDPVDDLYL